MRHPMPAPMDLSDPPLAAALRFPPTPQALRAALGRFATGVTLITCLDAAGARVGLTANSFSSLSLEPALVLWSLRKQSHSLPAFAAARHFAVNVLAESQLALSQRFASPAVADRFAEGDWSEGLGGAPVLAGATAVFECAAEARHDAGDHWLFIGRVLRLAEQPLPPLLYHGGQYRALGPAR